MKCHAIKSRGFTLIELAIVLVIITILIGGLTVPLSAQIQARRVAETNKTLEVAQDAIMGYAMAHTCSISCNGAGACNGGSCDGTICNTYCAAAFAQGWPQATRRYYLPCPDTNGDGIEETRAPENCPQSHGNLPWVTLGTAAQDAWGNRLHYSVTDSFSNRSSGFRSSDPGTNQVCDSATGGCASGNLASNVPVVVMSHGANGWGATSIHGTTLAAPAGTDELENAPTDADQRYVSRSPYKPADSSPAETAKEFDDQVIWIPTTLLSSRVCPIGGCL
ncbi:MAG: prepilin-type N-terminal cleavage/methylation domain-containing protein [Thiobacillus sp.]